MLHGGLVLVSVVFDSVPVVLDDVVVEFDVFVVVVFDPLVVVLVVVLEEDGSDTGAETGEDVVVVAGGDRQLHNVNELANVSHSVLEKSPFNP
jgi:hypothetical protein